jgi:sirohydrochlorin ferrochelatase
MKAILLIDHGSMRQEANHMLDCMGNLVQLMAGDAAIVRIAHMELAPPTVADGFAACVEAGATEIVVFPYMLSPGKHSTRDIPRMVGEAAANYPRVRYVVSPAFGVSEKLAEVILKRAGVAWLHAPPGDRCVRPPGSPPHHCGEGCRELIAVPAKADAFI